MNHVAVVTGGASGIGLGIARQLHADGQHVALLDRNGAAANAAASELHGAGPKALPVEVDVADRQAVETAFAHVRAELGPVGILVTSAGIESFDPLLEITPETWERIIAVNLTGTFNTTKAAMPYLLAQPGGVIVNVASTAGLRGQAYAAHYCASKAGVVNFTRSVALEFASRGMRINCLAPAGIKSPLIANFIPRKDFEPQLVAYYSPPVPHSLAEPADVAKKIAFLASDDASMINGAVLVADFGTLA
jgi:NAD(P)-dependent dehydrogenase (short-subunit alcohol dehydrogenase family)